MNQIEFLVQEITNRLLEHLKNSPKQVGLYLIGDKDKAPLASDYVLVERAEEAEYILVPRFSLDSFLRIANLCPHGPDEVEIVDCLLAGRQVFISNEELQLEGYRQSARNALYQDLLQKKAKLEQYGVQFYAQDELPSLLKAENAGSQKPTQAPVNKTPVKPKLLTESKLRALDLEDDGFLQLEKGTIVTALARDYLNRRRITIIEG